MSAPSLDLSAPTHDTPVDDLATDAAPHTDLLATPAAHAGADVFAERVLAATLGALELAAIHAGDRLGWYRTLAEQGPVGSAELARATGTSERYAREWLEHQAANGYVEVLPEDGTGARRFLLHAGVAEVMTDRDSLAHLAPLARLVAGTARHVDALHEAYRTGGGVSWQQLGADAREAQAALNRPMFLHVLTQELLPQVPALDARLRAGALVADVGCGEGWSSVGLALGHPGVTVHGYDVDAASVEAARRHASSAGVAERVRFTLGDAARTTRAAGTRYDVVTAFECLHDMPDPVGVLRSMREVTAEDGWVVVMDERTEDALEAPAGPVERLLYGFSLVCCLPDGLAHEGGVGTGTVMRPPTLERYAREAGFSGVEVLPVEHDMFRFYRLHL